MKGIISRGVIMIGNDWDEHLKKEYGKAYFQELLKFVDEEYHQKEIYPKKNEIFNAFKHPLVRYTISFPCNLITIQKW